MAIPGMQRHNDPKNVIDTINTYAGVDTTMSSRKLNIVEARQVAMYIIRKTSRLSLKQIAELFGKDHATVLYACQKVPQYIEVDKQFRNFWMPLLKEFNMKR